MTSKGPSTVITCGKADADGKVQLTMVLPFFGKSVNVYTAEQDKQCRPLVRSCSLAEKTGCAKNTVAMYLSRRFGSQDGIFKASSIQNKPEGNLRRSGLKSGSYFITIEVCQAFEAEIPKDKRSSRSTSSRLDGDKKHHRGDENDDDDDNDNEGNDQDDECADAYDNPLDADYHPPPPPMVAPIPLRAEDLKEQSPYPQSEAKSKLKPKRLARSKSSCSNCHHAKTKCDDQRPCARCIKTRRVESCVERVRLGFANRGAKRKSTDAALTPEADDNSRKEDDMDVDQGDGNKKETACNPSFATRRSNKRARGDSSKAALAPMSVQLADNLSALAKSLAAGAASCYQMALEADELVARLQATCSSGKDDDDKAHNNDNIGNGSFSSSSSSSSSFSSFSSSSPSSSSSSSSAAASVAPEWSLATIAASQPSASSLERSIYRLAASPLSLLPIV